MQCMYDQSHQTLSMTCNCSIPLGQTNIYNIKGRHRGTKGWKRRTPLEEENTSGRGKHLWKRKTNISACSGSARGLCLSFPKGQLQVSFAPPTVLGYTREYSLYIYINIFIAMRVLPCFLPCHRSALCSTQCICHWQLGTCFPVVSINLQ